jgi:hypothetical protein
MSCCSNTTCIQVFINDCTQLVNTGLVATQTGQWKIMVEFNGAWRKTLKWFNNGDAIIIPNEFNANYTSTVQIFTPTGALFNDTCYLFDMCQVIDATQDITATQTTDISYTIVASPSGGDGSYSNPIQLAAGATIVLTALIGYNIHGPVVINNGLQQQPIWDKTTGTLDNTANGGFNVGDLITISYEKQL